MLMTAKMAKHCTIVETRFFLRTVRRRRSLRRGSLT
jgi:hypothetical protein